MRTTMIVVALVATAAMARTARADAAAEIARFNRALDQATRTMSNAATLALWDDDGVSLLPNAAPIVGKKAIAKFLDDVMAKMPSAKMETFELACHDIRVEARTATEWCTEHQVVRFADGSKPFDGRGKMLLVLHKGDDGQWRLQKEMWNP
jgi:ketosteroid isomerase-like protein